MDRVILTSTIVNFGGGEIIRGQPSAVPGPTAGAGLLVYRLRTVVCSAGGDGGGKSSEHLAAYAHASFAAVSDCRTIAIYEYAP